MPNLASHFGVDVGVVEIETAVLDAACDHGDIDAVDHAVEAAQQGGLPATGGSALLSLEATSSDVFPSAPPDRSGTTSVGA